MTIPVIILEVIINFIIYLAFGMVVTLGIPGLRRSKQADDTKGELGKPSLQLGPTILIGFFAYYALFFVVCVPVMKMFRPLSMLTAIWVPVMAVIVVCSLFLHRRSLMEQIQKVTAFCKAHPLMVLAIAVIVGIQVVIVTTSYNFTLDASFYVAGVSTNVETNMINVYDPFTGAWQDHFEMRYFFATYPVADAVVCQLTGIAPLVQTKSVMAAVVIILTNLAYYLIAEELFENKQNEKILMLAFMLVMNMLFVTIYTSSTFLLTRTYEGKAIVGNASIMVILYLFVLYVKKKDSRMFWVYLFICCLGSNTIASTANMLIPAELSIFFLPEILLSKRFKHLIPYVICMLPGIILALAFVAYVKGYFVFYTYPVW